MLIVTGHARGQLGRADFEEMMMSGPGTYLEKHVNPDAYLSVVRKALGLETPASNSSSSSATDSAANRPKRFLGSWRQVSAPAGYFDKPSDLNRMLEKIEEILSSRPAR